MLRIGGGVTFYETVLTLPVVHRTARYGNSALVLTCVKARMMRECAY
jgi:hypothetical protein